MSETPRIFFAGTFVACLFLAASARGQDGLADRSALPICPPPGDLRPAPGEHPLVPLIRWGRAGIECLERLDDYTCTLVMRERLEGKLSRHQWVQLRVRHKPLSIYARVTGSDRQLKQEVVYVDGQNDGKMFAHSTAHEFMGTMALFPDSRIAMRNRRYPLTEAGILNLVRRLVEVAEHDSKYGECEVHTSTKARIDDRPCLCVTVTHPQQRAHFRFHVARVFIDSQLNIPVHFESYYWPRRPGEQPILLEQYTFEDFRFNRGLTDNDFNIANTDYSFPPPRKKRPADLVADDADSTAGRQPHQVARPGLDDHPLVPVLRMARTSLDQVVAIRDYTCLLTKRERMDGQLSDYEHMSLKVRQDPFSIYVYCHGPQIARGQEAIYVEDRNEGQVLTHIAGRPQGARGILRLPPSSPLIMDNSHYRINDLGLHNLLVKLIGMFADELNFPECEVRYFQHAKVDGRDCTCIKVTHPVRRDHFSYCVSQLYIDDAWKVPIRFEAYTWPESDEGTPQLVEEYTYRNIQFNRGLTDRDFDAANPRYGFSLNR